MFPTSCSHLEQSWGPQPPQTPKTVWGHLQRNLKLHHPWREPRVAGPGARGKPGQGQKEPPPQGSSGPKEALLQGLELWVEIFTAPGLLLLFLLLLAAVPGSNPQLCPRCRCFRPWEAAKIALTRSKKRMIPISSTSQMPIWAMPTHWGLHWLHQTGTDRKSSLRNTSFSCCCPKLVLLFSWAPPAPWTHTESQIGLVWERP